MKPTIRSFLAAAILTAAITTIGCGAGGVTVGYRAYDPYRSDYHVWDANEGVYFNTWVTETHRDPHRNYRQMRKKDQTEYWRWRHDHPDHR